MNNSKSLLPLKLNIQLENMPHGVFRQILVPNNINMMQLHAVIQIAMGWTFSHLFQFMDRKNNPHIIAGFGEIDPYEDMLPNEFEAHQIQLRIDYLEGLGRKSLWYWYDFGDDWWHKITVLKATKKDLQHYSGLPVCLDAFGKCPPEDVGGTWGYEEFCRTINNRKDPEYRSFREWQGMDFKTTYDFEKVDIPSINLILEKYFYAREWKRNTKKSLKEGWIEFFEQWDK
ncbi:MAG: plasmid pRiA4b ORF-3 family protein [Cyclobacteriaceae bacterium]